MDYHIWKHELPAEASLRQKKAIPVVMPKYAEVLGIGVQNNIPVVWEKHPVHAEEEVQQTFWFRLVETGMSFDGSYGGKYLGTLLMDGGEYVLHVFMFREF